MKRTIFLAMNNGVFKDNILKLNLSLEGYKIGDSFNEWSWINDMQIEDIKPMLSKEGLAYLDVCMKSSDFVFHCWLRDLFPKNALCVADTCVYACKVCNKTHEILVIDVMINNIFDHIRNISCFLYNYRKTLIVMLFLTRIGIITKQGELEGIIIIFDICLAVFLLGYLHHKLFDPKK